MKRHDLLSLTTDDLAALGNRGIVKRAQQEVQSGQLTFDLTTSDSGEVRLRWSDDVECVLPAATTISHARCTCPATELCRHLIRSVLAYQQQTAAQVEADTNEHAEPMQIAQPWNPASITDEQLAKHCHASTLKKAQRFFDEGQVAELLVSVKPGAYFHSLSCRVRFLVPNDLRYTHCDCAEESPCLHVPLAVWAFRLLPATQPGGVVTTNQDAMPVPDSLLNDIESSMNDLVAAGFANAPRVTMDRLRRLEKQCRDESLIWPAEILSELVRQHESYASHDARFSSSTVAELIAELCTRMDAIRAKTGAVPQLFIRGAKADRVTEIGSARLIGIGCEARVQRGGVELAAYLQDVDSGSLVAVCKEFADPAKDSNDAPKEFWQLAQSSAMKSNSIGSLGAGQLLIKGGKRTPDSRFIATRAQVSYSPQAFKWEALRYPLLAEDFNELTVSLMSQPPAALRPRRLTENIHVLPVAAVEAVRFDPVEQSVVATLRDRQGNPAMLRHPFTSRSKAATEALLTALQTRGAAMRFIAGRVKLNADTLVIAPIGLVFEKGSSRELLQPWLERGPQKTAVSPAEAAGFAQLFPEINSSDPLIDWLEEVLTTLAETILLGVSRNDATTLRMWSQLHERGQSLGLTRLVRPMQQLTESLQQRQHTLEQTQTRCAESILRLLPLAQLAQGMLAK